MPRRCSPTQLRAHRHQHSALLRWTDRRTHGAALRHPRQRHSPAIGPSRLVRRQPCHAHTKPFALATGGVQCHVRSGLPTKRRCVRRTPPAAQRAQLTLHAAAQVAEILKDYADDEMGDRRQVCASHAPGSLPATPSPWLGATHPECARQELVFIGVNMDREAIIRLLDGCLLTENELLAYNQHWNKESASANSTA